ncbi:PepSY-like domain-containing protein [Sphingobacterium faecale]|uniref:PepSY-like domain-containing protein n=1 Tax=Sphingobacterium faecale TaxID=2803775 RepID=A0ABS1R0F7_9SPHI|nr:PepSY-like domain-containing protein [Sphingobacterium faecale]MBL1408155.1 PepSY-like domain-containing protein [Sphingobacterium faecale]
MMKKLIFKFMLLMTVAFVATSCEKEELIGVDNLPSAADSFLKVHFKDINVLSVTRENEPLSGTEYKVLLGNRVEVKFDKNGNWAEVEALDNTVAIPTSFVLAPIVSYVKENYPNDGINSIDKEKHGFDVELTNALDLEFDNAGKFIRIDP